MIPRSFIEEIRQRIRLSDIVSRRVTLKRTGREFSGLCPFHNEKSPSFTVNDEKGFYHCFGCSASGDVIKFVMETEGRPYPEAIEQLAAGAGMSVPRTQQREDTADQEKRAYLKRLSAVMRAAAEFYVGRMRAPEGRRAYDYLCDRGLDDASLRRFTIGYAPDDFHALEHFLKEKGVTQEDMLVTGLSATSDKGNVYDRFRGRVMFPIKNQRGDIIGFGGRLLAADAKGPKYLNSPEGPLFDKSKILYNIDQAITASRQTKTLIVTEGYMDVCVPAAKGADCAVASMGTAIGEYHLALLWRHHPCPVICMDGDEAGKRAAVRLAERALPFVGPGKSISFVTLDHGNDPADYALRHGGEAFLDMTRSRAVPLVDMLKNAVLARFPGHIPEDQAARVQEINRLCSLMPEGDTAALYKRALNDAHWQAIRERSTQRHRKHNGKASSVAVPAGGAKISSPTGTESDPEACLIAMAGLLCCAPDLSQDIDILAILAEMEQPILDIAVDVVLKYNVLDMEGFHTRVKKINEEGFGDFSRRLQGIYEFYGFNAYTQEQCKRSWHFFAATYRYSLLKTDYDAQLRMMTESSERRAKAIREEMHAISDTLNRLQQ